MRIWSIHPKYLDVKGLLAVWRESLLAKAVLEEKVTAYRNHPQLLRFRNYSNPIAAINQYLLGIWQEATRRNYKFDKTKIDLPVEKCSLFVNEGQVQYEFQHLLKKLETRATDQYLQLKDYRLGDIELHHLFALRKGGIEEWEKI